MAKAGDKDSRTYVRRMARSLLRLRSPNSLYWCWGYSFPWQTRDNLVPRFSPNLVCTTFAAQALLDAYELEDDATYLQAAISAGDYISRELYWTNGSQVGLAYPLRDVRQPIHNANFLGAALLCRLATFTGEADVVDKALQVARYSASQQRADGSWAYGVGATQQWVDNFHTGYNLCALRSIGTYLRTQEFETALRRGFRFYINHLFTPDGAAKYFHNATFPVDAHSVAQGIITLTALADLDRDSLALARRVVSWSLAHLRDKAGFFYYRIRRVGVTKTPYMRWSQAWMLLALCRFRMSEQGAQHCATPRCAPRVKVLANDTDDVPHSTFERPAL